MMVTNITWGADGVARGNFAGINIWCICGIPNGVNLPVKDSKKTNKKQRAAIVEQIKDKCIWSLGSSTPTNIDEWGIQRAEAMALANSFKLLRDTYYIDKLYGDLALPKLVIAESTRLIRVKDADDSIPAVSAASIFAKWALDIYWDRVHEHYPEYKFNQNAGYGINAKEAINQFGLLKGIHRLSYKPCKEYLRVT